MKIPKKALFCDVFAVAAVILIIAALNSSLRITRYTVTSDKLPEAFNGCILAQVSDFHNMKPDPVIAKLREIQPDYIFLTGDYVSNFDSSLDKILTLCREAVKIAPVYAISGNHDVWDQNFALIRVEIEGCGVHWLENEKTELLRNGQSIVLSGIADPYVWSDSDSYPLVEAQLNALQIDKSRYNVLLFHRANMLDLVKDQGFDLTFSGHLHGGQVNIPFVGGLVSPHKKLFPPYDAGRFDESGTTMIVSRGILDVKTLPRVFNPAEIVAVTLEKS